MVERFFPGLTALLKALPDPRAPDLVTYSNATLCWTLILMYVTRLGSRRQIGYQLDVPEVWKRLSRLSAERVTSTPSGEAISDYVGTVPVERVQEIQTALVRALLETRRLESSRLLGTYYRMVFDLSGHLYLGDTPSQFTVGCLTQQAKDGRTLYYRPVEEAKLVTPTGLALSVGSEFVENPLDRPGTDPQDSELPAAARLFPKVKASFPRLPVCVLLDSRYANETGLTLCGDNDWRHIMTLKEGSLPTVSQEFDTLSAETPENRHTVLDDVNHERRDYAWVKDIACGSRTVHALECVVTPLPARTTKMKNATPGEAAPAPPQPDPQPTRFRWITDLPAGRERCEPVGDQGGRLRWKIENEGFRTQKHAGFAMEHAYVKGPQAAKNFYLFLQIAHLLCQIYECYCQGKRVVKKTFGSLINLAKALLESFRRDPPLTPELAVAFFAARIRVTFDTS
jgi:hypothetical protein